MRSLIVLSAMAALPGLAAAQCRLCAPSTQAGATDVPDRPLTIEVDTSLNFSRATGASGGSIAIDERSGARQVVGLTDLGGIAIKGSVRLAGTPGRRIRVVLPASVRLVSANGSMAEAVDLRTDLSPAPTLGADGILVFSFGGRLIVRADATGEFRGRVPITADYD